MKYHDTSWSEKAKILDGFVAATDYDSKYAIRLLHDPEHQYLQVNVVHLKDTRATVTRTLSSNQKPYVPSGWWV